MIGPTIRQGPHHGAQQSTSTGVLPAPSTSCSKVASVTIKGLLSAWFDALLMSKGAPHFPHFAWPAAARSSSTRFLVSHLLQLITGMLHLLSSKPRITADSNCKSFAKLSIQVC